MAPSKIIIVIPAYNEAKTIGSVVKELNEIINQSIEIVVVNDCSNDKTAEIAKNSGANVLDLKVNHGYSRAIDKGMDFAVYKLKADYVLTMDADGQHDPYSVNSLISNIYDNDIIIGKRPRFARISEWMYGRFFYHKFKISDPLCGLKIYKASIYKMYGKFETYSSIGTELLTWSLLNGLKVSESDIKIRPRLDEPRFASTFKAEKTIFESLLKTIQFIKKNS